MKYNFVYKTTNILNGDYYYGVHSTNNLDDGYMGSGKRINRSINKYGKENFTREIVQFFSRKKCAYSLEAVIVTQKLIDDPHCLNLAIGGYGGYVTAGYTEEQRKFHGQKISEGKKGKPMSDIGKQHIREAIKKLAQKQEWRDKISSTVRKTWSNKELREQQSKRLTGRKCSEETRKKISKSKSGIQLSAQAKQNISNATRIAMQQKILEDTTFRDKLVEGGKHTKGLIWINNEHDCKRVQKSELNIFLNNGWRLGRIKNNK